MRNLAWIAAFALLAAPAAAQEPTVPLTSGQEELVDRIVAVVGDSIILLTQIQEELVGIQARLQASGEELPPEGSEEFRRLEREVLDGLVNQQLLVQAAARDTTISVTEERIDQTLRDWWADQVRAFGSETALREAVEAQGLTLAGYRADRREEIRRTILLQNYFQVRRQQARPVVIEDSEIREYFERERERIGQRPATIAFRQVIVFPEPSPEAKAEARAEAERLLGLLRDGEDFADLARRHSDDEASRQEGGDLGWYRRGAGLVDEFEDAAFAMRQGAIAGPVETVFGSHIIQVERIRGGERKIHHILIAAERSDEDLDRARERAIGMRDQVREGASISGFAAEERETGIPDSIEIATDDLAQLPSGYASALASASAGDVMGPVEIAFPNDEVGLAVIEVVSVRPPGEYTLDDVSAQIRQILRERRLEERILEDLRSRTHIEIRI